MRQRQAVPGQPELHHLKRDTVFLKKINKKIYFILKYGFVRVLERAHKCSCQWTPEQDMESSGGRVKVMAHSSHIDAQN